MWGTASEHTCRTWRIHRQLSTKKDTIEASSRDDTTAARLVEYPSSANDAVVPPWPGLSCPCSIEPPPPLPPAAAVPAPRGIGGSQVSGPGLGSNFIHTAAARLSTNVGTAARVGGGRRGGKVWGHYFLES